MLLATGLEPEVVRQIFGYLLGRALDLYGVLLHAAVQMGNHHHLDITDVRGVLPNFKGFLHGMLARAFNCYRGRTGDFWERAGSCDTVRDNDEEAIGDLVYTDANPVSAGLVKWAEIWPGLTTAGWAFGDECTFERPTLPFFTDENEAWPPNVTIVRSRPPCLRDLSDEEATELLEDAVRRRCVEKQAEMRESKRRFRGAQKLAKERWWRRPKHPKPRYGVRPQVAVRCKWRRLAALQRKRSWEAEYAAADEAFKNGNRDVEFPHGTWLVRQRHGVRVGAAPS